MRPNTRHVALALAIATALGLAACEREAGSGATVGQKIDRAIDVTQQKLAAAGDRIAQETDQAVSNLKDAARRDPEERRHLAQADTGRGNGGYLGDKPPSPGNGAAAAEAPAKTSGTPPSGGKMSDAAITASIKTDFLKAPDLSILKIDVDTKEGVVTLNGLAENEQARQRAERMASSVKGVREVRNYLVVKRV